MAKKKGKKGDGGEPVETPSVIAHPRARISIRRWRGRAGLLGLVLVTVLSMRAGVPPFDSVMRGLAGGLVAHFVAWIVGIVAWRHLVLAELIAHREAQEAKLRAYHEAAERRAADALAAHAANQ
jgi:ABC-type xylose transport system permease subunit